MDESLRHLYRYDEWVQKTGMYEHYNHWQETRVKKVVSLFGKDFFENKTVLELGAAHGDIGNMFSKLGAIVTFAEGREENVEIIKSRYPSKDCILLDQNESWNLNKKFDVIIHWGVLYHLMNWKQDLFCAVQHSDILLLESEVLDTDTEEEFHVTEVGYDQALEKYERAIRVPAITIEKYLTELGVKFTRYDDADINSSFHRYDWEIQNTRMVTGMRRFWVITK